MVRQGASEKSLHAPECVPLTLSARRPGVGWAQVSVLWQCEQMRVAMPQMVAQRSADSHSSEESEESPMRLIATAMRSAA